MDEFNLTTTNVAAASGVLPETVRTYADLGLLEHRRLPNGVRVFRSNAAEHVREIYRQRLANRGGARR